MSSPRRSKIVAIRDWLAHAGVQGLSLEELVEEMCARLVAAGLPLVRVNLSMRTQHPEIGGFAYRWKREGGMQHEVYVRDTTILTGWDQSPLKHLLESGQPEIRYRIAPEGPHAFPMFAELVAQGARDYFAQRVVFEDQLDLLIGDLSVGNVGVLASWCAQGEDGFSERDLDELRYLIPTLALAMKAQANYKMADDLLTTYLGGDAARRVMSGTIQRGSVERIQTVILYFDLQGFTRLSETMQPEALIAMLNDYFGAIVGIIEAKHGTVLKFMGDGLLAIFPDREGDEGDSGLEAIDCVSEIEAAMHHVNARRTASGETTTGFTAALHSGEVLYGNIGGKNRLDFTVIGPAVNAAARISAMCGALDQNILVSAIVARPALEARPALVSLGQYRLRGVADRVELFTLD